MLRVGPYLEFERSRSLRTIYLDTTAIAAEAVEREHEPLELLTASSFDLISTPPDDVQNAHRRL